MLRSLLSVPADRPEDFDAARSAGADGLCFDLEDAVPVAEKAKARSVVAHVLESWRSPVPLWVRVNAVDSGLCADDLDAIARPALAGVQLPKAESAEDVRTVDRLLAGHERARGLGPGSIGVIATIESARGLLDVLEVATAAPRVVALMPAIGAGGDLQRDLGYVTTDDERGMLHARSRVVLAARAAGIVPLDGVHVDVGLVGFERSATAARRLGFRGKKVFHHEHVEPANRIFGDEGDSSQDRT